MMNFIKSCEFKLGLPIGLYKPLAACCRLGFYLGRQPSLLDQAGFVLIVPPWSNSPLQCLCSSFALPSFCSHLFIVFQLVLATTLFLIRMCSNTLSLLNLFRYHSCNGLWLKLLAPTWATLPEPVNKWRRVMRIASREDT